MMLTMLKDVFYRDQFTIGSAIRFDRERYFIGLFLIGLFQIHEVILWSLFEDMNLSYFPTEEDTWLELVDYLYLILPNRYVFDAGIFTLYCLLAKRVFGLWGMFPLAILNFVAFNAVIEVFNQLETGMQAYLDILPISFGFFVIWVGTLVYIWKNKPSLSETNPDHPLCHVDSNEVNGPKISALTYFYKASGLSLLLIISLVFLYMLLSLLGVLSMDGFLTGKIYLTIWPVVLVFVPMVFWSVQRVRSLSPSYSKMMKMMAMSSLVLALVLFSSKWIGGFPAWYLSGYIVFPFFMLGVFSVVAILIIGVHSETLVEE